MNMKKSCIDCKDFTHCGKAIRAWRKAWQAYPDGIIEAKNQENHEKRLVVMQTQYSICHEEQMTFQTFKVAPRLDV